MIRRKKNNKKETKCYSIGAILYNLINKRKKRRKKNKSSFFYLDARFNKALIESCEGDIQKYCQDEIIDDDDDDGKDSNDDDNQDDQKSNIISLLFCFSY